MKKSKLKAFTLLEVLLVMVIIWILAVVLTEAYITISRIALKVEQEKNLSEESLTLTQVFQSVADEAQIDYTKYDNLEWSWWFTDILHLTWNQWSGTSIYTTWECLDLDWNIKINPDWIYSGKALDMQTYSGCKLVLDQNGSITELTSSKKVIISKIKFRIIPYNSDENYFENNAEDNVINKIHKQAFWVFLHLYAPIYQPVWTNDIDYPLQLFFNLND